MNKHGFYHIELSPDVSPPEGWFRALSREVALDDVTSGRVGNHLTRPDELGTPLVRTTTSYTSPPRRFSSVHDELIRHIQVAAQRSGLVELGDAPFNNALLEIYDQRYRKMGFHSDQALDLDPSSYITIFSCYDQPPRQSLRRLSVKSKEDDERFSIDLTPHSAVIFSVETNARYLHKIHLPGGVAEERRWLGVTLRRAETYLQFDGGEARFLSGSPLTLADEAQRMTFLKLRGQENRAVAFTYPDISFTISPGDLSPPQ